MKLVGNRAQAVKLLTRRAYLNARNFRFTSRSGHQLSWLGLMAAFLRIASNSFTNASLYTTFNSLLMLSCYPTLLSVRYRQYHQINHNYTKEYWKTWKRPGASNLTAFENREFVCICCCSCCWSQHTFKPKECNENENKKDEKGRKRARQKELTQ